MLLYSFSALSQTCGPALETSLSELETTVDSFESAWQQALTRLDGDFSRLSEVAQMFEDRENIPSNIAAERTMLRLYGGEGAIETSELAAQCYERLTNLEQNLININAAIGFATGEDADPSFLAVQELNRIRYRVQTETEAWVNALDACSDLSGLSDEAAERILRSSFSLTQRIQTIERQVFLNDIPLAGLPHNKAMHSYLLRGTARMIEHMQASAIPIVEEIGLVDFLMTEQRNLVGDWNTNHLINIGGEPDNVSEETREAFAAASSPWDPFYYAQGGRALTQPLAALARIEDPQARETVTQWFREQDLVGTMFERLTLHTIDLSGWGPAMGTSSYTYFGPNFAAIAENLPGLRDEFERPRFTAPYPESAGMPAQFSAVDFLSLQYGQRGSYWRETNGGGKSGQEEAMEALAAVFGISTPFD